MINRSILAAIRSKSPKRQLPDVGTDYDEWYTVVLCPVCGHKTLDNYDICTHCGWEYDDLPEDHYSACNRAKLRDYRAQYQKALTMKSVFVGGSKSYDELTAFEKELLQAYMDEDYHILVGDCRGTDRAVQDYLHSNGYDNVTVYATEGKARHNLGGWFVNPIDAPKDAKGFDYYRQKDIAMADDADEMLMLWDGMSRGTYHNLLDMLARKKAAKVVLRPCEVVEIESAEELERIRNR